MPHEQMDIQQVSSYLHLDAREVAKLATRGQIPCRKVGGRFIFHKGELDHWVETQLHELEPGRLAKIEKGVSEHHGLDRQELLVCSLIDEGALAVPLKAKTRESVIRSLVELAERRGLVLARDELLQEIRSREELCTTAMVPAVALPHPRHPLPHDITRSFIAVGLTASGVPYGSQDGTLTRLFFLICCKDERTHLHVLARLAQMLHNPATVEDFLHAESAEQFRELLIECEEAVLGPEA